jgi:alpha-L-rhamnosidase
MGGKWEIIFWLLGGTSYGDRLVYQTSDVSEHQVVGSNIIEVGVAEGWYYGKLE